jgi:hypothetical protein
MDLFRLHSKNSAGCLREMSVSAPRSDCWVTFPPPLVRIGLMWPSGYWVRLHCGSFSVTSSCRASRTVKWILNRSSESSAWRLCYGPPYCFSPRSTPVFSPACPENCPPAIKDYVGWAGDLWVPIAKDHFAAVVGLPMAARAALLIVLVLCISSGAIEFEAWGLEFKGAQLP